MNLIDEVPRLKELGEKTATVDADIMYIADTLRVAPALLEALRMVQPGDGNLIATLIGMVAMDRNEETYEPLMDLLNRLATMCELLGARYEPGRP